MLWFNLNCIGLAKELIKIHAKRSNLHRKDSTKDEVFFKGERHPICSEITSISLESYWRSNLQGWY